VPRHDGGEKSTVIVIIIEKKETKKYREREREREREKGLYIVQHNIIILYPRETCGLNDIIIMLYMNDEAILYIIMTTGNVIICDFIKS
jgi:hypothetical protein